MERFWSKVDRRGPTECWPWLGGVTARGYGAFAVTRKDQHGAHRLAWELTNEEPIPRGFFACHRCDNPRCVNPGHIFIGTPKQNTQDMMQKGRRVSPHVINRRRGDQHPSRLRPECMKRGEVNPHSTLTEAAVRDMRQSASSGAELARKYGVAPITVSRIRRRLAWAHVQ